MSRKVVSSFDYEIYRRHYEEQRLKNLRRGYDMAMPEYTPAQARAVYNAIRSDRREMVKKGETKGVGNIYQYMVRGQSTDISWKRAKAINEMVKNTGQDTEFTFNEIRFMTASEIKNKIDWDKVKEKKKYLIENEGYTITEANDFISWFFFGSR